MGAAVDETHPAYAGQAMYSRPALALYDALVYGFNFPVLWRCPKARLVELYDAHVGARHLDIGVATGRLLDECRFPVATPEITLMDLNPNSLAAASRCLGRYSPRTHLANVLDPWGLPDASFDSAAMCNLLHCLPGTIPDKAVAFEHAAAALAPGGTLFGATILCEGVSHTWLSRRAVAAANRRGSCATWTTTSAISTPPSAAPSSRMRGRSSERWRYFAQALAERSEMQRHWASRRRSRRRCWLSSIASVSPAWAKALATTRKQHL